MTSTQFWMASMFKQRTRIWANQIKKVIGLRNYSQTGFLLQNYHRMIIFNKLTETQMVSERLFEDILVKYPELVEDKLTFLGRQVNHFGKRIDILFEDRFKEKLIVELKIGNLQRNALSQVLEYEGYVLSEKDPTSRVMIIANRIPLNLKKAMDHHGIEYKEITLNHLYEFIEKRDSSLLNEIRSPGEYKQPIPILGRPFTEFVDDLIIKGGTWEYLISVASEEARKRGLKTPVTRGYFLEIIRYRRKVQHITDYARGIQITEQGIIPPNRSLGKQNRVIIGRVTDVKANKDAKERFEIWLKRHDVDWFGYPKTTDPKGYPVKVITNDREYSIGFHNTKSCVWLAARLDRDGYNLTDVLIENNIQKGDKVVITRLGNDKYQLSKLRNS